MDDEKTGASIPSDKKDTLKTKISAVLDAVSKKDAVTAESARVELETVFKPIVEEMYKNAGGSQSQGNSAQNPNDMFANAGFGDATANNSTSENSKTDDNVQEAEYEEV